MDIILYVVLGLMILFTLVLAGIGAAFFVMVGKESKHDKLVGTNRFHRMMIVFLAAKHPEMFVKGFPMLSADIKDTKFVDAIFGRINNYEIHLAESKKVLESEQVKD